MTRFGGDRGRYLGPVRRIERVVGPPQGRFLAMVFEDGPTAAPPRPNLKQSRWLGNHDGPGGKVASDSITDFILEVLKTYGGAATFAIIGSTAANYPDEQGALGSPHWNGVAYDHFPEFGQDALAGAAAQPDLVRRIVKAGNELANHSWRHIVCGPQASTHRKRGHHAGFMAALGDLRELHDHVREHFGCEMRLGRPPHLVDGIASTPGGGPPGRDAYDVLAALGYNYVGVGVDGGGWAASSGSYDHDVERMVLGLQRTLEKDGRALCGAVISQKDGYNFSGESPVVTALPREMQLFRNYGYKVVTVSSLLEMSPFADLDPGHPAFAAAKDLLGRRFWVTYRDNAVRPEAPLVRGELAVWALGAGKPGEAGAAAGHVSGAGAVAGDGGLADPAVYADVPVGHPYRWHVETAAGHGLWRRVAGTSGRPSEPGARGSRVFGLWDPVSPAEFRETMGRAGVSVGEIPEGLEPPPEVERPANSLTHAQALVMIHEALK